MPTTAYLKMALAVFALAVVAAALALLPAREGVAIGAGFLAGRWIRHAGALMGFAWRMLRRYTDLEFREYDTPGSATELDEKEPPRAPRRRTGKNKGGNK